MKLLNIACGQRYHTDWINIDFNSDSDHIKRVNILTGLPFNDNSIDAAYSSHFLEHLNRQDGSDFINEIYRILKKDGIVRIVVPDLENLCKEYLKVFDLAANNKEYEKKYEWITIELIDQMVREKSGGEMQKVFNDVYNQADKEMADYILKRTGDELLSKPIQRLRGKISLNKIINNLIYLYLKIIYFLIPPKLRNLVFVNTSIGEKHKWMYDKVSLKILLEKAGFKEISIERHNTSRINNFNNYLLDIKADGTPYKGISSIYIEAAK